MYTTETNGVGDLRAAAEHRRRVAEMVHAANRKPCTHGCASMGLCQHGLDDTGLRVRR